MDTITTTTNGPTDTLDPLDARSERHPLIDPTDIAARYLAMWNEPDASVRRATIRALFTADVEQVVDPPEEMRDRAREIGFEPKLELLGHAALEARVRRAYEEFVEPGTFVFRGRDTAVRLRDLVRFSWDMVANASGEVVGGGLEVLALDDEGRIATAYQFIDR